MSESDLTDQEKAEMTAIKDLYTVERNQSFYDAMDSVPVPLLFDVDPGIRKAIAEYMPIFQEQTRQNLLTMSLPEDIFLTSAMLLIFLKGYELGRRLQIPLTSGVDDRE